MSKRPWHAYDRNYIPVPDAPDSSMIEMSKLPEDVQRALGVIREFERQGAAWPSLLANPARAWFRYHERTEGMPKQGWS